MRRGDVLGLIREAELHYVKGDRGTARRRLEAALRSLSERSQFLPAWVEVGARVQWWGEGSHGVYTVVSVGRRARTWHFVGELTRSDGAKEQRHFRPESGERYWRRYGS